MTLNSAGQQK